MAVASHTRASTISHGTASRSADHLMLEVVVGRLLEWMVSSVEGVRARMHRGAR
jgi:hypothetical protein